MRRLLPIAAGLLLGASGCRWPWQPETGLVVGTVRYPDRSPVPMARVQVRGGPITWTNAMGEYRLLLPSGGRIDTLDAWDGYNPGVVYAETSAGSAFVQVRRRTQRVDIVLDQMSAI